MSKRQRVIIGMSGGVDSSVAALLLKQQGYEVLGLFMKNWDEKDEFGHCPAEQDYEDVQKVCAKLDIPCYSVEFISEYQDHVFSHFLKEYEAGRTPNPDVLCNREIKFDVFLKKALEFGCDYLATGHYAQVKARKIPALNGATQDLVRAIDTHKDQTYFLTAVNGSIWNKVLFPIGHLPKPEVRKIAEAAGLATSKKKDSTGICFIGERKFRDFLGKYVHAKPGRIVDLEGETVGEHQGIAFFTLGQRKGLGLGGEGEPWFVVDKRIDTNELVVVRGENHPALFKQSIDVKDLNWFAGNAPSKQFKCTAKTRYRQVDQACEVTITSSDSSTASVRFTEPQRAPTPGQYAVFYDGEVCLGGGVITAIS